RIGSELAEAGRARLPIGRGDAHGADQARHLRLRRGAGGQRAAGDAGAAATACRAGDRDRAGGGVPVVPRAVAEVDLGIAERDAWGGAERGVAGGDARPALRALPARAPADRLHRRGAGGTGAAVLRGVVE